MHFFTSLFPPSFPSFPPSATRNLLRDQVRKTNFLLRSDWPGREAETERGTGRVGSISRFLASGPFLPFPSLVQISSVLQKLISPTFAQKMGPGAKKGGSVISNSAMERRVSGMGGRQLVHNREKGHGGKLHFSARSQSFEIIAPNRSRGI